MKDTTAIFDEAASRRDKRPRFRLNFVNHPISLTSWPVDNCQVWDLIDSVGAVSGNVVPDEGKADVESLVVKVIDDDRFHHLVPLLVHNEPVMLSGGFENILEADYTTLITGLVDGEIALDTSLGLWSLRINDLKFYEITSVFRTFGKTALDGNVLAADVVIDVDSTIGAGNDTAFHDPVDAEVNGWLLIDNEIISYTGMTDTSFTGCGRGELGAAGGSDAEDHADGAEVFELFVIEDNPIDILLKMLCSTGAGANGAYDVWQADQGLGVDHESVDIAAFEAERNRYLPSDVYRFVLKETIGDAKKWMEQEIHKSINSYPVITGDGLISFRLFNPPFAEDPEIITEGVVARIRSWKRGLDKIINNTWVAFDYSITAGGFLSQRWDLEVQSVNDHGFSKTWKGEFKGLYSDLYADAVLDRRVSRLFTRYKDGCPRIALTVDFGLFKIDAGDIVEVTLARVPDLARGVRGIISKWMEVVSIKADPQAGAIDAEIWDTRLAGKFGMICPNTYPTYALATDEQKRWAYICETATELMPDGDPPTLII